MNAKSLFASQIKIRYILLAFQKKRLAAFQPTARETRQRQKIKHLFGERDFIHRLSFTSLFRPSNSP
jgi:hypothetical protein